MSSTKTNIVDDLNQVHFCSLKKLNIKDINLLF